MKISKYIILAIISVLSIGCSDDFLDLPPKTFVTSDTFYTTPENFEQAVNGIYAELASLFDNNYIQTEMRSDNTHYLYKPNDRGGQNIQREDIDGFIEDPFNSYNNSTYSSCYEGIAKANTVLTRLEGKNFTQETLDRIKGQALFFRAFFYFELLQNYGGVPIYTQEVVDRADAFQPRASVEEVYQLILDDANLAADLLPVRYSDVQDKGRVTKGAAHMLLGYVNMTLKDYSAAEDILQPILGFGYSLMGNYEQLFDTSYKNNSESIFEVQYKEGDQGVQSNWTYIFIPPTQNTEVITGVTGNNELLGGWNTPTPDLINSYENGDKRKSASIAESYIDIDGNIVNEPYTLKYLNPHALYNNTNDNWYVYRYADALLLLAESLNEQNRGSEAIQYINLVRNRAGLPDISNSSQSELRAVIAHERRVELAFENHRWLDLVRTDQAVEVMNTHGIEMKNQFDYLLESSYQINENKLLYPIPQGELDINSNLTQNPGY